MFSKPKDLPAEEPASVTDHGSTTQDAAQSLATYEVDDFASLDDDQVAELTARVEADVAKGLTGCAHLVVTCDLRTGLVQHHIPCSSGKEALALAAQVLADKRAKHPKRGFTIKVTPLLPH